MSAANISQEKPLIVRWIGPVLMVMGLMSVVQGMTIFLGGMELPGAPAEMNEFMHLMAKMIFPMGFVYLIVGFAFFKSKKFARPLFFGGIIFGGLIMMVAYATSSSPMRHIFLGQIPGAVILSGVWFWYFYMKKNVVQYYRALK